MTTLKNTVPAEELLAEDSGNLMGGLGSKPEANRVGSSKVKGDGSSPAAVEIDKQKVCSVLKIGVQNLSSEGFEGTKSSSDSVIDGSSEVIVARDEKMTDADFNCTDNVGSSDGKRKGEKGTINLNADVNVGGVGMSVGRWNRERVEDQDHGFRVGDLVWGKIKNDPWWPGQVFDPRDASESALKYSQEGRFLVAFFGAGWSSWCLPSQLVPFVKNLERMRSDKPSRTVVNAVQRAVDEIGRCVESRMTCRCIPFEKRGHLARPVVANAGVKPGVLVPEVDIYHLCVPEYGPAEICAKLVQFAKAASFDSVLELAILRSWISAISYKECGGRHAIYSEPLLIEGLEDKDDEKKTAVRIEGPEVDEGIASPKTNSVESQVPSGNKVFQRRKQKTVSELMAEKAVFKSQTTPKRRDCDGADIGSSSRERKKSKYLSPPYTILKGRMVDSGSKLESDLEELTTAGGSRAQEFSVFAFPDELDENEKKATSGIALEVNDLLQKIESAAIDRFYLRDGGYLDPVWAFISAYRDATYVHGSDYKTYHKCTKVSHKRKKPSLASPSALRSRGCSPKISLPRKRPADDLVPDARAIRHKLDLMTKILETYGSRFSSDDKSCLKEVMKRLMEEVATAGDKVRLMAEKTSS